MNNNEIMNPALENDAIDYKQGVLEILKTSIDSYLEFSTPQELLTVVADSL